MGYGGGGTFSGTLNVDIVQTDVQAIVDGICGGGGQTLTDLNYHLSNIDSALYAVDSVAYLLSGMWVDISDMRGYLWDNYSSRSAADILVSMESILNDIRNNTAP